MTHDTGPSDGFNRNVVKTAMKFNDNDKAYI